MPYSTTPQRFPGFLPHSRLDFYREEFLKHRQCLEHARPYFSERAITDADAALSRILAQLDYLCTRENADQLVTELLRSFEAVTKLSAWTDPRHLH